MGEVQGRPGGLSKPRAVDRSGSGVREIGPVWLICMGFRTGVCRDGCAAAIALAQAPSAKVTYALDGICARGCNAVIAPSAPTGARTEEIR